MKSKRCGTMCLVLGVFLAVTLVGWAHCEVPCGIFGDDLRFSLMMEDADTIAKCMNHHQRGPRRQNPGRGDAVFSVSARQARRRQRRQGHGPLPPQADRSAQNCGSGHENQTADRHHPRRQPERGHPRVSAPLPGREEGPLRKICIERCSRSAWP